MHPHLSRIHHLLGLVLLTFSYPAFPQALIPADQEFGIVNSKILRPGETALRDLNQRGITFQGIAIYDWSKSFDNDDSAAGFGRYSFDFSMPIDGKKLWGLTGSAAMVRLRNHANNFGLDSDGDAQL